MNKQLNDILSMNYPDFVGFINQWNVLPGAFVTLSKWAKFSDMNESSNLLQVACTTGFQSRELAVMTKCKGKGLDLSHEAIKMANYNKDKYAPDIKIEYFQADGLKYEAKEDFSHVAIGAGAHFFPDPAEAIKKCISFLQDGGFLLASPFYARNPVPDDVIALSQKTFGITPTCVSYKDIMAMYKGLEVIYEDRNYIYQETEAELKHYCESTIKRACEIHSIDDQEIYDAMYKRLYDIRCATNALRLYQEYAVLVLRYRESIYPNRYVELF